MGIEQKNNTLIFGSGNLKGATAAVEISLRGMLKGRRKVVFNVSGEIYETFEETLSRYPETLLGNRKKRSVYYCSSSGLDYFDRSRLFFDAILTYYQLDGRSTHFLYKQLYCLSFNLRIWSKTKQLLSKFPTSNWSFFYLPQELIFTNI